MTRCHYGGEPLRDPTDVNPVRGVEGAYSCAAHAMMYGLTVEAEAEFTLAHAVEAMKVAASKTPRDFVKATVGHMAKSPHFAMALLIAVGHELTTREVTRLLMEVSRVDMATVVS